MHTPEHYLALTIAYLPLSALIAATLCWLAFVASRRLRRGRNRRRAQYSTRSGLVLQTLRR